MTLQTAKVLLVATVVLTTFAAGATATTDATVDAQPITNDATSLDNVVENDEFCQMSSGVTIMCGGAGGCSDPEVTYC
ncbi:hypothetical protein M0R88_08115 [Halorussus gelatinilyticus]|uniref:Uncharacterized protein n=1 Tax=Halorussus gelatinilyticus TaxID=2937524 RepID=A0A8U0IN97_9EURY|nr:hypothetical protein [Halorussus gelatinilyticus]UPW02046.1 hypothetical protein M0R88_08115 [Halorussus gelatinilyticus]